MNQYDENNEYAPIHKACWKNNVEILTLLLKYNPNINLLCKPNNKKYTTMHIAALKQNVSMMKLLIQHGFDCQKFINNIYYEHSHRSVFLELCVNGNVECMDYLMNKCKNKIDIQQRDINGFNGLHLAVKQQHLSMVEYLLDNVYNNHEMKMKIFNQSVGISGKHTSVVAAEVGTTEDGLDIFKLLKQNKCPIHDAAIEYAAYFSSLILDYMLNHQLYPNYKYLSNKLIRIAIKNAHVHLVHKNVLIIIKHLSNMKDKVSMDEYQEWIINIFFNIMMNGTMDGYFELFKEMIVILLNNDDWKCFGNSEIIDKKLLLNVQSKINNPTNTTDIIDEKWCILLNKMIDSFDDDILLLNDYESDLKEEEKKDKNDDDYYCNKNHLMTKTESKRNNSNNKCSYCNTFSDTNPLSFECIECIEYICVECINNVIILNDYLKNETFSQFDKKINQLNKIKQKKIIIQVELFVLNLLVLLLYFFRIVFNVCCLLVIKKK